MFICCKHYLMLRKNIVLLPLTSLNQYFEIREVEDGDEARATYFLVNLVESHF